MLEEVKRTQYRGMILQNTFGKMYGEIVFDRVRRTSKYLFGEPGRFRGCMDNAFVHWQVVEKVLEKKN